MSLISRCLFACFILSRSGVQDTVAFTPIATPFVPSSVSGERSQSILSVCNSVNLSEDLEYVQGLEDKLIYFSKIDDDDTRRNDFEAFVIDRLQEELEFTNKAAKFTIEKLKLQSLDFVKTMDKSILKLGQLAQDQGWESHVTSGFQPVSKGGSDIWPYVDMLIQFKLLISNMERMANKRNDTMKPVGNGNNHFGCPGLGSFYDSQRN